MLVSFVVLVGWLAFVFCFFQSGSACHIESCHLMISSENIMDSMCTK